jgi:hypothetical protein
MTKVEMKHSRVFQSLSNTLILWPAVNRSMNRERVSYEPKTKELSQTLKQKICGGLQNFLSSLFRAQWGAHLSFFKPSPKTACRVRGFSAQDSAYKDVPCTRSHNMPDAPRSAAREMVTTY